MTETINNKYPVFLFSFRNLAQNPLRRFTGSLEDILPSITILDLTGVTTWKPDKQVFRLPMLTQVVGFSLTNYCTNCVFFLPTKSRTFKITHKIGRCHQLSYSLTDVITRIANLVNGTAFQLRCEKPWRCGKSESTGRFFKLENFCWKDILIMLKVQGILGIFGLIFNMVLILNILTSKSLRQNITLLFVCNMGISDFLLSVYAAFLTVYLSNHSYHYLFYDSSKNNWKVGFIWMLGQTSTVITSFFLTLERYLVIVYSLNPSVRISFRMAYLMIAICWLIAMFFTVFAFYYDFYSYTFLCIPIYLNHAYSKLHYFTIVVGSTGMGFYIISFFLYLHIYIVAKRTAQNAGVKRESQVAKRIAMVIFSNVFFFLFPIILTAALMCLYPSSVTTKTVVLTLLSLSLNSLLNPVIYAFRNDRFKHVFNSHFNTILKHMSKGGLGKSHKAAVIKKQQASNKACKLDG